MRYNVLTAIARPKSVWDIQTHQWLTLMELRESNYVAVIDNTS